MKRCCLVMFAVLFLAGSLAFAQGQPVAVETKPSQPKVIMLISEQNIEGPQTKWWVSEIDLSSVEAAIANKLVNLGVIVLDTSLVDNVLKRKPAFRKAELSDEDTVSLADLSGADYVITGKAVATAGHNVPQSNMVSCYANVTVKVLRVSDKQLVGLFNTAAASPHLDEITGGTEALIKAGEDAALKIYNALNRAQ